VTSAIHFITLVRREDLISFLLLIDLCPIDGRGRGGLPYRGVRIIG
jgi:hypothetical protein